MKLLTKKLRERFRKLGFQDGNEDPTVIAKFFYPGTGAVWFATELNEEDDIFYGYVSLINQKGYNEWGYFSLEELEKFQGRFGMKVERDLYFTEQPMTEAKKANKII
jgi:hypothetical protein